MARRRMAADFDDDLGDWGDGLGLGEIVTPEQLKGLLLSGIVGGGGILTATFLLNKLPAAVTATWKSVIGTVVGLVGGRLLWGLDPDAARGFAGGVAGWGIAELVRSLAPGVQTQLGQAYDPRYGWGMGMGQAYDPRYGWGMGLGRTRVEPQTPGAPPLAGQFGRTRVEQRQPGQFMTSGLSQDVAASVGTWIQ